MLARIRTSAEEKDQGFTLIELLVVMIIIGILAAIAVPVFLSQRAKAQDTAVKSDVTVIGKEVATWYVDNTTAPTIATTGTAPNQFYTITSSGGGTNNIGRVSNGINTAAIGTHFTSSTAWCVDLTNPSGDQKTYKYSATGGLQKGVCQNTTAPVDY